MAENPYQPPQVLSSPGLGLARLLGCAAAVNLYLHTWRINGVSLKVILLVFGPIFIWVAWVFIVKDQALAAWVFMMAFAPSYLFLLIASIKHNIIFTATSQFDPGEPNADFDEPGQLFISGKLVLDESDRTRLERILHRLMTGRSANHWFVRAPSELSIPSEQPDTFCFHSYLDPSLYFFRINLEHRDGWWNAIGKVNPHYQQQLGLLQCGIKTEPAVKIGYFDQRQRQRWIVVSSTSFEYLRNAVLNIMKTALVKLP